MKYQATCSSCEKERSFGERGRNRTFNLLIKSQLGFWAAFDASTTIGGL
jgi:hypothetical protein